MKRILFTLIIATAVAACAQGNSEEQSMSAAPDSGVTTLQKTDVTVGSGTEAKTGATVSVHYTGWLYDAKPADHRGTKFDSSKDSNSPFQFRLGAGEVIQGWDEGVAGMKVGGTRVLTIPATLGYGSRGAAGVIPPNATLVFEVELLDVR
jgi:FKBP-type peptidyl-prolyl cis-trans isomerase FkpA